MKLSASNQKIARQFLQTGELPSSQRSPLDGPNSRFSDQRLSDRMDDYVALDMGLMRGDQDDRFGVVVQAADGNKPESKVRVYGDSQDGGFRTSTEQSGVSQTEYVQFESGSVRHVVITETAEGVFFVADHHSREGRDQGYSQSFVQKK